MVNLSDVAAMGGRATAVVDALWAVTQERGDELFAGMRAASDAYGRSDRRGTRIRAALAIVSRVAVLVSR